MISFKFAAIFLRLDSSGIFEFDKYFLFFEIVCIF